MIGDGLMRGDILGSLRCVGFFVLLLGSPGQCVGWLTNLHGFRSRGAIQQLTWSITLSFATMPLAAVILLKYSTALVGWWLVMACAAFSIGVNAWALVRDKGKQFKPGRLIGIAVGLLWVGFVIASLTDVAIGNRLYLSVTVFDHALRSAFVDAVLRTGVPPANPLYFPGGPAPMRYYYFWYVLVAAVARLAGAGAHAAFIASVVWAGFGLAAMLALYCRHFLPPRASDPRRWPRMAIALGLLAVTGLDVLPAIVKAIIRMPTDADMEWWSSDQVSSWMDSLLWVPHHVASLVCCLFGFLLVWMAKGQRGSAKVLSAVIAGLAFASAFGLSIWVAVGFALVMLAWVVWVFFREQDSRTRIAVLLGAGAVAVLVLGPYLRDLSAAASPAAANVAPGPSPGGALHLLHLGVRRIIDLGDALPFAGGSAGRGHVAGYLGELVLRLLLLIPGYFVELGFFGLVLLLAWRAVRRRAVAEAERTAVFLSLTTLALATFVRSNVVGNNDFGWRTALIAQFFLLLLAVRWCEGALEPVGSRMRRAMWAMLWIGLAGTVYQAVELRLYLPVEDRLGRPDQAGLAERAMALRQAGEEMDRRLPEDAVIQYDTGQPSDYFRYPQILFANRQIVSAFPGCVAEFGGSPAPCPAIRASIGRLFEPVEGGALTADQARAECAGMGATDLEATRWDGVWFDRRGWVWTLPAAVDTGDVRVVDCRR